MSVDIKDLNLKGSQLLTNNKLTEAESIFNQVLSVDPHNNVALISTVLIKYKQENFQEVIKFCDLAISSNQQNIDAYFYKGASLSKLARYEDAIFVFDKIIENNPQNYMAYYNKATALNSLNRKDEALVCYDKCLEINPKYSIAYTSKGNLLKSINKIEEAMKCYDKSIELDPKYIEAYIQKGCLLKENDKKDESILHFNKAIELNPNSHIAYFNKGIALSALNRNEEAMTCYNKVIELNPKYCNAYFFKGNLLRVFNRKEEAIECYNKAIELNPNFDVAFNNLGVSLKDLDKKDEAIRCYNKAIELNPNFSEAYNNKGYLLYLINRFDDAIFCYEQAIKLSNSPIYYSNKAICLKALNKFEDALVCLNQAQKIINDKHFKESKYYLSNENMIHIKQSLNLVIEITSKLNEIKKDITELENKGNDVSAYKKFFTKANAKELKIDEGTNNKYIDDLKLLMNEIDKMKKELNNLKVENKIIKEELKMKLDDIEAVYDKYIMKFDEDDKISLKNYFCAFLKTMSNLHTTSQVVISEQVKIEDSSTIGSLVSALAGFIPVIGEIASKGITTIDSLVTSSQLKTSANYFLRLFINQIDLQKQIGKLLLEIVKNDNLRNIILNSNKTIIKDKEKSIFNEIKGYFENIKKEVDVALYSQLYKTSYEKLGHQDANYVIKLLLELKGEKGNIDLEEYCVSKLLLSKSVLVDNKTSTKTKNKGKNNYQCECFIF